MCTKETIQLHVHTFSSLTFGVSPTSQMQASLWGFGFPKPMFRSWHFASRKRQTLGRRAGKRVKECVVLGQGIVVLVAYVLFGAAGLHVGRVSRVQICPKLQTCPLSPHRPIFCLIRKRPNDQCQARRAWRFQFESWSPGCEGTCCPSVWAAS